MALIMGLTAALTGISTLLLIALLLVYGRSLKKIKSSFTIGLFVFAALFLVQNIVSLYFYATMMDYYAQEVAVHAFILALLEAIAFLVLLRITWE